MSYIGKEPINGNFSVADAITTSSTATYALTVGSVAFTPESVNHCIVSLNGVIQAPTSAFTISGTNIVFNSALTSADVIDFIYFLGHVNDIGTPSDNTVSQAKLVNESVNEAKMQISNAGSNGQFLSKQSGNTGGLTWAAAGGSFKGDESMFLVTKTADQSISHDTITLVTWETAYINVGSDFDLANEKYTCPSDGKYLFTWGINLTANENAKFDLGGFYFYKNNSHNIVGGNTQELSSLYMDMRGNPTRGTHISNTVIVDCSTSDYFTIKGFYNDVDGSGDQGGLISQYYTSWGGYKLTD